MKNTVTLFILLLFSLSYSARFRADTVWATKGGYIFGAQVPTSATADSLIAVVSGDSIAKKIRHGYAQIVTVAKGGGNYTTIQAAINSVLDASETKRYCVYVYPGLYTEQVTMKKFVDLAGVNKQTTQVQFTGNNNGTIILSDSVQICDISVKTTVPSTEWGVVGTNVSNVFIRDFDVSSPTYIVGLNSSGIKLTGTIENIRIERVVINCHSTTGIDLYVSGNTSVASDPGIAVHDSYFSTFDATTGGCIYIKDQYDVIIMNCYMRTSAAGYNLKMERSGTTPTNVALVNNRMLYGTSSVEVGTNCSLWVENTYYSSIANSGTVIPEIGHHHNNLYDSIADTAVVRVVSGKVGIGTAPGNRFLRVQRQVEILGNATLGGRGLVESITTAGREYMIFRADSVNALGAGMNLFGNDDSQAPGAINLYTNNKVRFRLDSNGTVDSIYALKMRWLANYATDSIVTARGDGMVGYRSASTLDVDSARAAGVASGFIHGATTGYHLKAASASTVGNSLVYDNGDTVRIGGQVGLGITPGTYKLAIYKSNTNDNNRGLQVEMYGTITSAGSYNILGANYWAQEMASTANSSTVIGMYNNSLTSRTSGTLSSLSGVRSYYGTYTGFKGTVTSQHGILIGSYRYSVSTPGTVVNSYDLYIASPSLNATPANVTNDYCIYSLHDAPSYFSGDIQLIDSKYMLFGNASDAGIMYDGTDLIFNSQLVGTGDFRFLNGIVFGKNLKFGTATKYGQIDSTGYRAYGDARAWDDVGNINLSNVKGTGTAGEATWTATGNRYSLNQFAVNDSMQGVTEFFHRFENGDTNEYHFHYETAVQDGSTRYIKWGCHFIIKVLNDSSTYDFTAEVEDTILNTVKAYTERVVSFGKQYVPNLTIGASVIGVVKRVTASGTAPSVNPYGKLLGVHHRVNDLGSRTIYTK